MSKFVEVPEDAARAMVECGASVWWNYKGENPEVSRITIVRFSAWLLDDTSEICFWVRQDD